MMQPILAVTGVELLSFLFGCGTCVILGYLAALRITRVNQKVGYPVCRLRDFPAFYLSWVLVPITAWIYRLFGLGQASDTLVLTIIFTTNVTVTFLWVWFRLRKNGYGKYAISATIATVFTALSPFFAIPFTLRRRIV